MTDNKPCLKPDCDLDAKAKGHCPKHHQQFKKYGYYLTAEDMRKHRTEAAKLRHSSFKKGCKTWNTGKKDPWTDAHIEAIKKSHLGKPSWNKGTRGLMPTPHNKIGEGITPLDKLERRRFHKTMQKIVLQRDDYTCQICDVRGHYLQVDHIKGWSKYPELRFDINNCRTVCMACHYYVTFKRKIPEGIIWGHNLSRRITS